MSSDDQDMKEHLDREKVKSANISYHDSVAHCYDASNTLEHPRYVESYKNIFENLLSIKSEDNESSILDVGCGTGFLLQFLDQPGRKNVFASDITLKMLQIASAKYTSARYFRGDSYSLPFRDGTFDFVLCNSLLHHLYDWESALVELVRVLKRGGTLFVGCEPNSYVYRLFNPLRKIYHKFARDKRIESAIESGGIQETDEKVAEFHRFYRDGIDVKQLSSTLTGLGAKKIDTIYTSIGLWANLADRTRIDLVRYLPSSLGPLSVSFHCIAHF
jgi:ubiquinone/menaquinone biosynthesis C-methylase UbiE